ncbi:sigma-70 family RNA polymerase sigma factor [Prolixibacteraceae bacterium Z1-6]|uniref:Sigma-70 family RNA polymerase sigma factor n=1 Tax=Draconibacterium aestuarii TaxID=2998507 RepID=A0A9X3F414_9BACT|nr:sigma-70 family RNA polymerase sigma factor [Prolixibacteraceae bacterium Z1-6]
MQNNQKYWSLFKDGDREALGKIFQIYYKELYFYGLKIVPIPELVKDVIQEMFVQLWEKRDNLGQVVKVKSYLLVAVRNELIHESKRHYVSEKDSNYLEPFTLTIEDFLINEEDSRHLNERLVVSLNKLSERQREVIMLRFFHNLCFEELAEVLRMNVQSVRNLLFRALEKLRNDLKDIGFHGHDNIELILFALFSKKRL